MTMTRLKHNVAKLVLVGGIGMGLAASFLNVTFANAPAVSGPEENAEVGEILDKAVEAHGGAEKLGQFKAVSAKWVGKHKVENVFYWDAVRVVTYQMPDKIRLDYQVANPNGSKFSFSRVVTGKTGWQGSARGTRELKDSEVALTADEFYAHWLASVVPLKEKGFEFSPAGSVVVDGKDAVGIRVSCQGRPDVNLYFDKRSGLVIKSERRAKDPFTNEEYTAESFYRDYKSYQGVMWPSSRLDRRDGMDLEENSGRFELGDYQAHDKLEENALAKP